MIRRFSPAKVNLLLRIGSRLPDGYHQLQTVMLPISLGDWLAVSRKPDHESPHNDVTLCVQKRFDFSNNSDAVSKIPTDEQNLIVKVARGFLAHCGISTGVHFVLQKSIPAGGGLGGASSNAAATLLLLNELFELGWTWKQLAAFSANYGSDIAFFTQPRMAVCSGRGEIVEPFDCPNSGWCVIVRPPFGLSTPAVFAELARKRSSSTHVVPYQDFNEVFSWLSRCMKFASLDVLKNVGLNDLQSSAVQLRPELSRVEESCAASFPLVQLMTGSGSCWYSLYRHRRQAVWAANRLRGRAIGQIEVARPVASCFSERGLS
jgi:4-diphosphocytidyl-2-C-methyl-D-erythritol kinase